MSKAQIVKPKQPKLTEHQRYTLGMAVQNSYLRYGWDGTQKGDAYPKVHESGRYSRGTSVTATSIKAMLRSTVISPSTSGSYRLTMLGVEIGEEECLERTGTSPKVEAGKAQVIKAKEEADHEAKIEEIVAPFKGIKVNKARGKKGKRDLGNIVRECLESRSYVEFDQEQMAQLGAAIAELRGSA